MPDDWTSSAPTKKGSYWFYGDECFGSMGGHFTGSIPPRLELHYVTVRAISNGMMAVTNGRFMPMRPFDPSVRREGYVGVWQPVQMPSLPTHLTFKTDGTVTNEGHHKAGTEIHP